MPTPTPPSSPSPWHAVHGGPPEREAVAPSKPAVPTTGAIPVVPTPIEDEDAEVLAPVEEPPAEEIMPSATGALWTAVPEEKEATAPEGPTSPFASLGDTAVRNASLAASGAPTPMAGIPRPQSDQRRAAAPGGPGAWFAGDPRENAPASAQEWSAGSPDETPASIDGPIPELEDPAETYTPAFGVPISAGARAEETAEAADGDGDDGDEPPARDREPWWRSTVFLIIIGLLVLGGIGYGIYLAMAPEPTTVELTEEVVVANEATPTLDPIEIADPTDFQAALPSTVGTFVLTDAQSPAVADAGLEVRAAEIADLTYSDGESELEVRAIQHFSAEAAQAQFDALAADGTDRQPVQAGGADVGERASIDGGIVWRNATVVFILTGPADELEDFYATYPL